MRHGLDAARAPRGPENHHDHLPAHVGGVDLPAVDGRQLQRDRLADVVLAIGDSSGELALRRVGEVAGEQPHVLERLLLIALALGDLSELLVDSGRSGVFPVGVSVRSHGSDELLARFFAGQLVQAGRSQVGLYSPERRLPGEQGPHLGPVGEQGLDLGLELLGLGGRRSAIAPEADEREAGPQPVHSHLVNAILFRVLLDERTRKFDRFGELTRELRLIFLDHFLGRPRAGLQRRGRGRGQQRGDLLVELVLGRGRFGGCRRAALGARHPGRGAQSEDGQCEHAGASAGKCQTNTVAILEHHRPFLQTRRRPPAGSPETLPGSRGRRRLRQSPQTC